VLRADQTILHISFVGDEDGQHLALMQCDKVHMPQNPGCPPRHPHKTRHARQFRENACGGVQDLLRIRSAKTDTMHQQAVGLCRQRYHPQQCIDKKTIADMGGDAPGGSVGGDQVALILQVRHDITHGSGTDVEAGITGQLATADRHAFGDMLLDEGFEQVTGAFIHDRYNLRQNTQSGSPRATERGQRLHGADKG
jgi:hypothetical protein